MTKFIWVDIKASQLKKGDRIVDGLGFGDTVEVLEILDFRDDPEKGTFVRFQATSKRGKKWIIEVNQTRSLTKEVMA